jgi:hypothetical protein
MRWFAAGVMVGAVAAAVGLVAWAGCKIERGDHCN